MSDVIDFPGDTNLPVSVDQVLDNARHLDKVLVIGWENDEFYVAMSDPSVAENILMAECARKLMLDTFINMLSE